MGRLLVRQEGPARAGLSLLTAAAVALACAMAPGAARAAAPLTFFDAPHELRGQLGPHGREEALDELDRLGVDVVRMIVYWVEVVPTPNSATRPGSLDPRDHTTYGPNGRNWGFIDAVVKGAKARGMKVSLVPSGKFPTGIVPRWVSADPNNTRSDPAPAAFESFMYAMGSRYSGFYRPDPDGPAIPRVDFISAFNEPNSDLFLGPRKRRGKLYVPSLYRKLVFAARRGLSESGWDGTFLIGETAPRKSVHAIAPLELMRGALCLNRKWKRNSSCSRLPGDGWAHHPYSRALMPHVKPKDPTQINPRVLGKLITALNRAGATGAVRPRLPVWITEFGVEYRRGRSALAQAAGIGTAERLMSRHNRVRSVAQYLLRDDPTARWAVYSGLRKHGSPIGKGCSGCKPAMASYRLPLAVRAHGRRACFRRRTVRRGGRSFRRCVRTAPAKASVWGHVRPVRGRTRVVVWVKDRRRKAKRVRRLRTSATGHFTFKMRNRPGRKWRVHWNGHRGTWVPAYRY